MFSDELKNISWEEKTLANRKENYTREAAKNFKGRIFVPDDLEVIEL